jgi:hypothetical protein
MTIEKGLENEVDSSHKEVKSVNVIYKKTYPRPGICDIKKMSELK